MKEKIINGAFTVFQETVLYDNKLEMAIKSLIWFISWLVGICTMIIAGQSVSTAGAYLIFGLSLLMEFSKKLTAKKSKFLSRLLSTGFLATMMVEVAMSIGILVGVGFLQDKINLIFNLTIAQVIILTIDCILMLLLPDQLTISDNHPRSEDEKSQLTEEYLQRLQGGNMGDIDQ